MAQQEPRKRIPVAELALIGIAAVWGLTFPMVKEAVSNVPTSTFLAYRFLSATLIVGVFSSVTSKGIRRLPRSGWAAGLLMGVFLTSGYVFQTLGLERTSASNGGFITGLFVVLTPLFGALLFRQRAGAPAWAAAAASALGLFLLSRTGGTGRLEGDVLVFLCACSFSFHIIATDRGVRRHDIGALLTVQLGVCGIVNLVAAASMGDLVAPPTGQVWTALVVTSLLATALGFYVQTYAQRHASPARTALILASEPAFAGLFAYLLLNETLTPPGWLGATLILAAIVAVELVPYLRPTRPLPEG